MEQVAAFIGVSPGWACQLRTRFMRIPEENGQRSGGKTAAIPMGKRPAFRLECGRHSGENGQYKLRV